MNGSGILHLKDGNFNIAESRETQLLIRVAANRLSYAIVNQKDNRLLVLYSKLVTESAETELDALIRANAYLQSPFAAVKMSVETFNFTLIPVQYFTKDDLPGYEKLAQSSQSTKTVISTINAEAIKCVSALELEITAPFISLFSQIKLSSQVDSLVEGSMKLSGDKGAKLLLQFNAGSFELLYSLDDSLVFYNIFPIANEDDFNYYLLSVVKQLKLESQHTSVYLAGNIHASDESYLRVEKYFDRIHFAESSKIVSPAAEFKQIELHEYFSLLSLRLCE